MKRWLPRISRRWLIAAVVVYLLTAVVLYSLLGYAPRFRVDSPEPPPKYGRTSMQVVGFSTDGRLFATHLPVYNEEDEQVGLHIRLRDAGTGELKRQWQSPWPVVNGAAFSPNSRFYVVQGVNLSVRVWDVETGKVVFALNDVPEGDCLLPCFCFSPDGRTLVLPVPGKLHFIDTQTWRERTSLAIDNHKKFYELVTRLAVMFDTSKVGPAEFDPCRFSPDSRTLFWPMEDTAQTMVVYCLNIIDVATGTLRLQLRNASDALFTPDSKRLVVWEDEYLRIHDATTGKELCRTSFKSGSMTKAWFCPRTGRLYALLQEYSLNRKQHLVAWDYDGTTLRECQRFTFNQGTVSPDKRQLASLTKINGSDPAAFHLHVHQVDTGIVTGLGTVPRYASQREFSPCGRVLATDFSRDERETAPQSWHKQFHEWLTGKPQPSDDMMREYIAGTLDLRVWDLETGKESALPVYHAMGFSPDGKTMVTLNADYEVDFWHVPPRRPWLAILSYAFLPAFLMCCFSWWRTRRRIRDGAASA
jgi:WD40 repeat protein